MRIRLKTLSDKITAIVIYLICMTLVIAMFLEVSYMADYGLYNREGGKDYAVTKLMKERVDKEYGNIMEYVSLSFEKEKAKGDKSNAERLKELESRYNRKNSNLIIYAESNDGKFKLDNLEKGESLDRIVAEKRFCLETERTTNFYEFDKDVTKTVTVRVLVRDEFTADDTFRLTHNIIEIANVLKYPIIVFMLIALVAAMGVLAELMMSLEYHPDRMRFIDRIPFDIFTITTVVMIGFDVSMIVLMSADKTKEDDIVLWNAVCAILAFLVFCIMLVYFLSLAVRIKQGHIYRNTLVYKLIERVRKRNGKEMTDGKLKMPYVGKLIITVGFVSVLDLVLIIFNYVRYITRGTAYKFSVFVLIQVAMVFVVGTLFFCIAINFNRLRDSGNRLAKGDYGENLDSRVMFGDFKAINDNFITIKDDMIKALEEKNKNEKMRSELIANISHDIKSPLTSIINYTDIIRSGKCSDEELNDYYQIINRQSKRLTDLLQNLIDVSQITTGSVEFDMDKLNYNIFISQLADAFSVAMDEKKLDLDLRMPQDDVYIVADGMKLWRAFENLFSNVCKYAMPGTRVYLSVDVTDGRVKTELKNISEKKINSTPQELLERFKRDDASRHTDGNGLGLSIVKSLTELQGGEFEISVDGDLFKAIIIFDIAE